MKKFILLSVTSFIFVILSFLSASESYFPSYITLIKAWRHGETVLTETGKEQAEKLAQVVITSGPLDILYTSDLNRAINTAAAVLRVFARKGQIIEQRTSMQLREILNGKIESIS